MKHSCAHFLCLEPNLWDQAISLRRGGHGGPTPRSSWSCGWARARVREIQGRLDRFSVGVGIVGVSTYPPEGKQRAFVWSGREPRINSQSWKRPCLRYHEGYPWQSCHLRRAPFPWCQRATFGVGQALPELQRCDGRLHCPHRCMVCPEGRFLRQDEGEKGEGEQRNSSKLMVFCPWWSLTESFCNPWRACDIKQERVHAWHGGNHK